MNETEQLMREMAYHKSDSAAKRHFEHKPYTVFDYLSKLGIDTKGEIAGEQEYAETVPGVVPGNTKTEKGYPEVAGQA